VESYKPTRFARNCKEPSIRFDLCTKRQRKANPKLKNVAKARASMSKSKPLNVSNRDLAHLRHIFVRSSLRGGRRKCINPKRDITVTICSYLMFRMRDRAANRGVAVGFRWKVWFSIRYPNEGIISTLVIIRMYWATRKPPSPFTRTETTVISFVPYFLIVRFAYIRDETNLSDTREIPDVR
jgi:hypothetical protein